MMQPSDNSNSNQNINIIAIAAKERRKLWHEGWWITKKKTNKIPWYQCNDAQWYLFYPYKCHRE